MFCGQCHDSIDDNGYCDCEGKVDPIRSLAERFPSPVVDNSDASMWREESDILRRLYDAGPAHCDSPLIESRGYIRDRDTDTYAVAWYWEDHPAYPNQWDGPVIRLWSRLMIRPVRCAGGYTWVVLSDAARSAICDVLQRATAPEGRNP